MQTQQQAYLSRVESSEYLGVSLRAFDVWLSKGLIPTIRVGRRRLFDRHDLDEFYRSLKVSVATQHERTAHDQ